MAVHLDSELLRSFVAIADGGSFTRGAAALGRTQSAVSLQMKRLEGAAGRRLFEREARGVSLTATGERLLGDARRIVRLIDRTARALEAAPVEGAVRVGIPEEYGASLLPRVLARFAERHPAVQVTVRCEASLAFAPLVAEGALDLAVLVCDRGAAHGEVLRHDPSLWATSARHLAHEQEPLPLALFERGCWWRDWAVRALEEQGRRFRIAYSSESIAGIQAAIASGLAVGVLGESTLLPGCRPLGAAEGFTDLPGSTLVLSRGAGTTPAADGMAEVIREAFRARPPASAAAERRRPHRERGQACARSGSAC